MLCIRWERWVGACDQMPVMAVCTWAMEPSEHCPLCETQCSLYTNVGLEPVASRGVFASRSTSSRGAFYRSIGVCFLWRCL